MGSWIVIRILFLGLDPDPQHSAWIAVQDFGHPGTVVRVWKCSWFTISSTFASNSPWFAGVTSTIPVYTGVYICRKILFYFLLL